MDDDYAIITDGLSKTFGTLKAVDKMSLKIKKGEIFGLLGPNGAGKSTFINMLTTMILPTSGKASVLGYDIIKDQQKVRESIGVITEKVIMYDTLTAAENLRFFGNLYGMPKNQLEKEIVTYLKEFKLFEVKDKIVGTFSTGMKRRLDLIRAILNDPAVLFLDEPTLGLDPITVRFMKRLIKKINENGVTIVLTTHIMQDADELSDRVALVDNGKILVCDTPQKLKAKLGRKATLEEVFVHYAGEMPRAEFVKFRGMQRRGF
jgi:ABC-2 type transport system ATP-binding protein